MAGDYLYIDGGDFSFMNNGTPNNEYCKLRQYHALVDIDLFDQQQLCSLSTSCKTGPTQRSPYVLLSSPAGRLPSVRVLYGTMKVKAFYTPDSAANRQILRRTLRYLRNQFGHSSQTELEVEYGLKRLMPTRQL